MLLDTGAYRNLVGDEWVHRMDQLNKKAGLPPSVYRKTDQKVTLGGVGTGTQESEHDVHVPCLISGEDVEYKATVLDNSDIPAILGMKTMQERNGILDLRNKRFIFPTHKDDVQTTIKSDTRVYQLTRAPGGYFMLPCSPGTETLIQPTDYLYSDKKP